MSNARLFLGALSILLVTACGAQGPVLPEAGPQGGAPRASTAATDTTENVLSLGQLGSGNKSEPVLMESAEPGDDTLGQLGSGN